MVNGNEGLERSDQPLSDSELWLRLNGKLEYPTEEEQIIYYSQKLNEVRNSEPTWRVRNFDADSGRVFDYFNKGLYIGFIESDWTDLFNAYTADDSGSRDQVPLAEAIAYIEALPVEN